MALIVIVAAGLLAAVVFEHLLLQAGGVAIATLAIVAMLAQVNRRLDRAAIKVALGAGAAATAEPAIASRTIGGPKAIVSVIIPGKNEAAYARDCVRSLKRQTLRNFEAVLVDDGSTDATLDVLLDEIGDDRRFRIYRTQQSIGIGRARNEAIARSTSRYITFLDLDDFLAPNALVDRVELAEAHADMPWVAGSYCWHEHVDPDAKPETWQPGKSGRRGTISWMSHIDDNVVIVTTPLIRRDAFLAVGGFDAIPTAEDSTFWFKLLRWGFILVGSGTVAVAYRQKPTSHAVSTAVEMRDVVAGLLGDRSQPKAPPADQDGPFFYEDGVEQYRSSLGFTRRTASALGQAVAAGSPSTVIDRLVDDLRTVPFPFAGWEANVPERAMQGADRVLQARGERARTNVIAREIGRLVRPVIADAERNAGTWLATQDSAELPAGSNVRPVKRQVLLPVTPQSLKSVVGSGRPILLLPSAAYHTDELIELVEVLRGRGFAPVAMLNDARWATTASALARVDVAAVKALPAGDWLLGFEALFTFNDWGEYYAEYVRYVKGKGPVSFAKVEGVQDWLDDDTGRERFAYLASDVVLCQGDNDVHALEGRRDRLEVIGSDRLEAIWNAPLPADARPRVVGNVNFTYGVQTDHRELWVGSLREACQRTNVPLDLSLHPSETARYPGLASADPIRHLMVKDSILVSRFSTVLFEGMARGCSVIYYNPHDEKVPTFHHPDGAFDIANDPQELARHLEAAKGRSRAEAKDRAAAFFAGQVSMIPGSSVATRTVDAIERNLGGA
ncbi:MAG TPA: glycosyltransferase family A protein [Candidatus Limnocylindrales bacterium]|nr:glycosyltransferase family A protein [Candidatus Limnocylindrales bacterium]